MSLISYASLDEVWGEPFPKRSRDQSFKQRSKVKSDPSCGLYKKKDNKTTKTYEDIIDTYLDDTNKSIAASSQRIDDEMSYEMYRPTHIYDTQVPDGYKEPSYSDTSYGVDSLEYERFFKNDNLFVNQDKNNHVHIQDQQQAPPNEEEQRYPIAHIQQAPASYHNFQNAFKYNINENIQPENKVSTYLEFGLYIVSGVFLIIILEQILRMGVYLK